MPYIDRDALIDRLARMWESRQITNTKYKCFTEMLIAEPTADVVEAPRWIPVTERLPGKHRSAIVTDFCHITLAYTNNLDEWMDYDGNRLKNVTAWMPLPEPYREEATNAQLD